MAHTYQDLIAQGLEPREIRRKVRDKELVLVRRGVYAAPANNPEQRHRDLIESTVSTLGELSVLSHVSAAVLHGLPVPIPELNRIHFTRSGASGKISRYAHRHGAKLAPEAIVEVDGFAVTAIERTIADLARYLPYADGVAAVDAALHRGIARDAMAKELIIGRSRPNNDRFRRALDFGDGLAESPGESRSRVLFAQLGLPMPLLQREFVDADGNVEARVDFDWPEHGTVGEFDGEVKYGRLLKPGRRLEDVIRYEKRREELLRRHDRWLIRWVNGELGNPAAFGQMILRTIADRRDIAISVT